VTGSDSNYMLAHFGTLGCGMDDGSETAIKDGDWVLVDTSLTDPVPGKVFLHARLTGAHFLTKEPAASLSKVVRELEKAFEKKEGG